MRSYLVLFVFILLHKSVANLDANVCAADIPNEKDIKEAMKMVNRWENQRIGETTINQVIMIKTVWHLIKNGEEGNFNGDVDRSMKVLNEAFSPHFQFYVAKINVVKNTAFWDVGPLSHDGMKLELHEGDCSVLNVYSTKYSNLGSAKFPKYCSTSPSLDGVIISYDTVPGGTNQGHDGGHTLTHEVGHWLNLYHIFEGGCDDELGDGVDDTPASKTNRNCPLVFPNSCPERQGFDLVNNFMDYTNDACKNSFTNGQFNRMMAAWDTYRKHSTTVCPQYYNNKVSATCGNQFVDATMSPLSGPGGTVIKITNVKQCLETYVNVYCRFKTGVSYAIVPALRLDESKIECVSPPQKAGRSLSMVSYSVFRPGCLLDPRKAIWNDVPYEFQFDSKDINKPTLRRVLDPYKRVEMLYLCYGDCDNDTECDLEHCYAYGLYGENLARTGVASQSSTYASVSPASNAIDGYYVGHTAHTNYQHQPWWKVDLLKPSAISKVCIWNRPDCCKERMSNTTVEILDAAGAVVSRKEIGDASKERKIEFLYENVIGNTIQLIKRKYGLLNIAQVEVYGITIAG